VVLESCHSCYWTNHRYSELIAVLSANWKAKRSASVFFGLKDRSSANNEMHWSCQQVNKKSVWSAANVHATRVYSYVQYTQCRCLRYRISVSTDVINTNSTCHVTNSITSHAVVPGNNEPSTVGSAFKRDFVVIRGAWSERWTPLLELNYCTLFLRRNGPRGPRRHSDNDDDDDNPPPFYRATVRLHVMQRTVAPM